MVSSGSPFLVVLNSSVWETIPWAPMESGNKAFHLCVCSSYHSDPGGQGPFLSSAHRAVERRRGKASSCQWLRVGSGRSDLLQNAAIKTTPERPSWEMNIVFSLITITMSLYQFTKLLGVRFWPCFLSVVMIHICSHLARCVLISWPRSPLRTQPLNRRGRCGTRE